MDDRCFTLCWTPESVVTYHFHSYIYMILQLITLSFQRFFYLTEKVLKGVGFYGKLRSRVNIEVSLLIAKIQPQFWCGILKIFGIN